MSWRATSCGIGTGTRPSSASTVVYGRTPLPTMLNAPVARDSTAFCSAYAASCSCTNCISGSWPIITGATGREKNRVYMFEIVGPRIGANRRMQTSTFGCSFANRWTWLLGADLVVDEPRVAVAAQLGVLGEEVRVLRMRAVDQRRRDHDEPARLDAGARVEHVHRADVLELVRPLRRVRRVREERAVDERVDLVALEQRRELAVDRRLREVELDELDLAAGRERGRADVEREHLARTAGPPRGGAAARRRGTCTRR